MKILQFQDKPVGKEWQYKFCIFFDESSGTEVNESGRVIPCRKPILARPAGVIETYKTVFNVKEVYVSTNGQGTERD